VDVKTLPVGDCIWEIPPSEKPGMGVPARIYASETLRPAGDHRRLHGDRTATGASTAHGAGRTMSRAQAKKRLWGETLMQEMRQRGIVVRAASKSGVAEEAGFAYKDLDEVVNVVHRLGISRKVVSLKPMGNIKG
jgi:hypothetical protein